MRAFQLGRALAQREGVDYDADLGPLLAKLGLEVIPWRFDSRVREFIFDGAIGVEEALPSRWRRWVVAHAIGHHVLHVGASLYLAVWQGANIRKDERQAEEFAAGLLVSPAAAANAGEVAIAERCAIPREKARWFLANLQQ